MVELTGPGKGMPFPQGPPGIDVQQVLGHLPHRLADLVLGALPLAGAQLVELRLLVSEALVAVHPVQPVHRHIELGPVPVFDLHEIPFLAGKLYVEKPLEHTHPVIPVHDKGAGGQLFHRQRFQVLRDVLLAALRPQPFVAEHLGGREEVKPFFGQIKAAVQRVLHQQQGGRVILEPEVERGAGLGRGQLVFGEHLLEMAGLAAGAAGHDCPVAVLLPRLETVHQGSEAATFLPIQFKFLGKEGMVAGADQDLFMGTVGIGQGTEMQGLHLRRRLQERLPVEKKLNRRQYREFLAEGLLVIGMDPVPDQVDPPCNFRRFIHYRDCVCGQIGEKGLHRFFRFVDQGQIKFYAGETGPVDEPGDQFIARLRGPLILGRGLLQKFFPGRVAACGREEDI